MIYEARARLTSSAINASLLSWSPYFIIIGLLLGDGNDNDDEDNTGTPWPCIKR